MTATRMIRPTVNFIGRDLVARHTFDCNYDTIQAMVTFSGAASGNVLWNATTITLFSIVALIFSGCSQTISAPSWIQQHTVRTLIPRNVRDRPALMIHVPALVEVLGRLDLA